MQSELEVLLPFKSHQLPHSYPYVSHAIFNAGATSFCGIDWPLAVKEVLTRPVHAATFPVFKKQISGQMSADGLGLLWQCNVFGHYVLVSFTLYVAL